MANKIISNIKKNEHFMLGEVQLAFKYEQNICDSPVIKTSNDAHVYFRKVFPEHQIALIEMGYAIALNRGNKVIGWIKMSSGSVAGTIIDPLIIAQFAIICNCKSIIIAHNHPSGRCYPSLQDNNVTEKISKLLNVMDMNLTDHLILSGLDDSYYSFGDEGNI